MSSEKEGVWGGFIIRIANFNTLEGLMYRELLHKIITIFIVNSIIIWSNDHKWLWRISVLVILIRISEIVGTLVTAIIFKWLIFMKLMLGPNDSDLLPDLDKIVIQCKNLKNIFNSYPNNSWRVYRVKYFELDCRYY